MFTILNSKKQIKNAHQYTFSIFNVLDLSVTGIRVPVSLYSKYFSEIDDEISKYLKEQVLNKYTAHRNIDPHVFFMGEGERASRSLLTFRSIKLHRELPTISKKTREWKYLLEQRKKRFEEEEVLWENHTFKYSDEDIQYITDYIFQFKSEKDAQKFIDRMFIDSIKSQFIIIPSLDASITKL